MSLSGFPIVEFVHSPKLSSNFNWNMPCAVCPVCLPLCFDRGGFPPGGGARRQEEEGGWSAGDGSGQLGKLRHSMEKLQAA